MRSPLATNNAGRKKNVKSHKFDVYNTPRLMYEKAHYYYYYY